MRTKLQFSFLSLGLLLMGGNGATLFAQTNEPTNAPEGLKVRKGLKLADVRVHDPFIVAHQPTKTYYLYTASGPRQGLERSGVVTYKSKDLREWEGPFVVFTVPLGFASACFQSVNTVVVQRSGVDPVVEAVAVALRHRVRRRQQLLLRRSLLSLECNPIFAGLIHFYISPPFRYPY